MKNRNKHSHNRGISDEKMREFLVKVNTFGIDFRLRHKFARLNSKMSEEAMRRRYIHPQTKELTTEGEVFVGIVS